MPRSNCSDALKLSNKLHTSELLMLNQKHNWRHVSSCFKTSGHVRRAIRSYKFPKIYQECLEITDDGVLNYKRAIGSEHTNNCNPIMLRIIRPNRDVRFLGRSTDEMYCILKYVVKNQNTVDNIAALTLSSYTIKLEKEKKLKEERTKSQVVYGRIASIAYGSWSCNCCPLFCTVQYLLALRLWRIIFKSKFSRLK